MSIKQVKAVLLETLEGHLRAILGNIFVLQIKLTLLIETSLSTTGTLTVEEIYRDRDKFAGLVREVSSPDLGRMG